ncbi:MAG: hypothetical protein ACOC10_00545 [Bacteroidota bacterium]
MGYLQDQKGILSRYFREKDNWSAHLHNCHNFIQRVVSQDEIRSIAILGSGWLLDVPMDFLIDRMEKIWLVDIFHPREIRHQYKQYNNIEYIEDDITGDGIQRVYDYVKEKRKRTDNNISSLKPADYHLPFPRPDLVVSLNLLNQLDILLVDYLLSKNKGFPEDLTAFRKSVQQQHLNFLLKRKSILISDMTEHRIHLKTQKIEKHALVHVHLPEGKEKKTWTWIFDTHGLYYEGCQTNFEVKAVNLTQ